MKKDKKLKSWGEAAGLNWRALGIFYKYCPQRVVSGFVCIFWNAITPYVGIYLSALLIDELAGPRDPERLRFLVLVIAVMLAITYIAPALSNKASGYWAINADSHELANRLFGFFAFSAIIRSWR